MLILTRVPGQKIHIIGAVTRHVVEFVKWTDKPALLALVEVSRYKIGQLTDVSEWVISRNRPRVLWVDEKHQIPIAVSKRGHEAGECSLSFDAPKDTCEILREELLTPVQSSLRYQAALRNGKAPSRGSKHQPSKIHK